MSETPTPPQGPEENKPVDPTAGQTPADGSLPGAASPGAGPVAEGAPVTAEAADAEKNKVMALLSYLGILWLIPLLVAKDSPFAKYHVNQGILLSIAAFGGGMVLSIGYVILGFIPILGKFISCCGCFVIPLFWLGILIYMVLGVVNVMGGKMKPLPLFPAVQWVK